MRRSLGVAFAIIVFFLFRAAAPGQKTPSAPRVTPTQRTARYLRSIAKQPEMLIPFFRRLPKGGDLHNHLSGAVYAESYIHWAAEAGDCVARHSEKLYRPPCQKGDRLASQALRDSSFYTRLLDAWSMLGWHPATESGHDHFFATFGKYSLAERGHMGDMLAQVAERSARQHLIYLELMETLDRGTAARIGESVPWTPDFALMRRRLARAGLARAVSFAQARIARGEARMRQDLACGTPRAKPGCRVTVRFLYQAIRALPPGAVFAQFLTGFALARKNPWVVGLNLVAPEDGYVALHDFMLQMHMLQYLHRLYPAVKISLHAGELYPQLVRPRYLRYHIRDSIEIGHASRIGHGVDIMHERHPFQLLREMRRKNILVEICLTSNADILGIQGPFHPLPVYLRYRVPVALATDDQGVARSDISRQFLRAELTYHLGYPVLQRMIRNSLDYAFIPGRSLWRKPEVFHPIAACARGRLGARRPAPACAAFLKTSPKARLEWRLERQLRKFEARYGN